VSAQRPRGASALADFTVELDVYSGPYEWLLALILKEEVEIFEVPLRELVRLYLSSETSGRADRLDRDTDFVGSAAALVLLKSRTLSPPLGPEEEPREEVFSPAQLADRLARYMKVRGGAHKLRERLQANAGFYPSAHLLRPRPGRLRIKRERLEGAARRAFSRHVEPSVRHLGPITVTLQELVAVIRASLTRGPLSFEELTREMNRLHSAVAFAAALSLAQEGNLRLRQPEPLGPLTLEPPVP
jgi:segregation and condensation protein A